MPLDDPFFLSVFPLLAGLVGLCLGSFYSVCAHRYLSGESIVRPGSKCPECGHPLSWWELIPVLSWLLLRGRCSACKARVSVLYPALELASCLWATLLAQRYGPTPAFGLLLALGGIYLVASLVDLKSYLLPNRLTMPAALIGFVAGAFFLGIGWKNALIGAAAGYGVFWLLAWVFYRLKGVDGLGGGDVKLMLSIGAVTGWLGLPFAVLLGSLAALVCAPFFLRGAAAARSMPIPFGPFLCFGAMAYLLYGPQILALASGR